MIRFSAFLVVVAVGLLVAGVVTSKLLLVYIAIGVSGVALLALGVGAAVNWSELTGKPKTAAAETSAQGPAPAPQPQAPAPQAPAPQAVPALAASQPKPPAKAAAGAASVGSGWPAAALSGPSRAGYLPTEQPLRGQPPWASPSPFQPASARAAVSPTPAQPAPAAFTARPQAPAPPAPPQAGKPVPPHGEDAAEPSLTTERKQSPPTPPSAADQMPAKEQTPEKDQSPAEGQTAADQSSPQDLLPAERQGDAEPAVTAVTATAEAPASPQADQPEPAVRVQPEPAGPNPNLEVTVVPGVPRYHNAHCILIRFMGEKDLETMTRASARETGCTPCRACLPDQPEKARE